MCRSFSLSTVGGVPNKNLLESNRSSSTKAQFLQLLSLLFVSSTLPGQKTVQLVQAEVNAFVFENH